MTPTDLEAVQAEDAETVGPAYLEAHTYGDKSQHWDDRTRHFVIVRCDDRAHGPIALNSGHHYTDDVRTHAVRLMAEHNRTEHGKAGIDVTERASR